MRSWKYYRASKEAIRKPNVFPGPLNIDAGDRLVHYYRSADVDHFGVYTDDHGAWLAAQPEAVELTEVLMADVPVTNWHSHRCAQRKAGWDEIGMKPSGHYRVVDPSVVPRAGTFHNDQELVEAVAIGEVVDDGPLPDDTPSRDTLIAEGIDTVAKALAADLTAISGIGEKTAARIVESLPNPLKVVVHVAGPNRKGLLGTNVDLKTLTGAVVSPHTFG